MNLIKPCFALLIVSLSTNTVATNFGSAQSIQQSTNASSASSQKQIDKVAENSLVLQKEIEQLEEEIKNLQVYQNHLTALIDSQSKEASNIEAQIKEINNTRRGIVPLMYQMISGLKTFIEQDLPIKREARLERIAKLEKTMIRADVSDAEKYRRILEAYQIELEYGVKLGAYQGKITVGENARNVQILHLGRVSLVARSLDGNTAWSWNQPQKQWQLLDHSIKPELDIAFNVAQKQVTPSLLTLPLSQHVTEVK
ncbi:DUF3450 domain-containing protein [Vibrio zhanjiangensis]|uniref:DUF3450 domain-containing protein n=1 Tax=Vibrio zhanjiangensis TaxID=1046128 RepID=A0ABQ6F1K7_9VIBR|nr:DUF3450 domain-containing protein [Vibrio zhanjiangensis]GLT19383.1 DUF3450 domain-containing protein [Vibrio zhanjiangensis]